MKLQSEAILSMTVTVLGAAIGFCGNLYLLKALSAPDYLIYGFAISTGGLIAEGFYLWQKNACVALSGCRSDAIDKISGIRPIIIIISVISFLIAVVFTTYSGYDLIFGMAVGLIAVLDGNLSIQIGLFRASGLAKTSYYTTFVSTVLRWGVIISLAPTIGIINAFIVTVPFRLYISVWARRQLLPKTQYSLNERQIQRSNFWSYAKGFILFSVCYALINHTDRLFFSAFADISANDAKEQLFYSIFGSQVVGLFCSSLLTVFYPRLVAAKSVVHRFRKILFTGAGINIFIGSIVLFFLYASLPLFVKKEIIHVSLAHKNCLLGYGFSQIFIVSATIAQVPCILFARRRLQAIIVYVGCTLIYLFSSYFAVTNSFTYSIPVIKMVSTSIMFILMLNNSLIVIKESH